MYTAEIGKTTLTDPYAVNGLQKEIAYLLSLDEDRLLAGFYQNSALGGNGHAMYGGGWEGALIGGHTLGHYLSALAQAAPTRARPPAAARRSSGSWSTSSGRSPPANARPARARRRGFYGARR